MSNPFHPLDPLRADEIADAVAVLRAAGKIGARMRFVAIVLHEPPKAAVTAFDAEGGDAPERCAWVNVFDRADGAVYEAIVSLANQQVVQWEAIPGAQPMILAEEADECEAIVKADPDFRAALARRGIANDLDLLMVEPWPAGTYWGPDHAARRLIHGLPFLRSEPGDNGFARPIEGLAALVDMNGGTVLAVEDNGVVPLPPEAGNYAARYQPTLRGDVKPLEIVQPEGPSFMVEGQHVRWQKWDFRVGWTPREGLVLHAIGYEDAGRRRPILSRASLSEMVVPYGDPTSSHYRKNAFDVGEFGIGMLANSLTLGCDCLGHIHYFDAVMVNAAGEPQNPAQRRLPA